MKITLILLLTTAFSAFCMDVHSQNAKVSLDTNIMKVAQLISAIESQTNYLFVYSLNSAAILFFKSLIR